MIRKSPLVLPFAIAAWIPLGLAWAQLPLIPVGKDTAAPAGKKELPEGAIYKSHIVTQETVGHSVKIDVPLKNAPTLFLVVTDGGDSFACDWANWVQPRVVTEAGEVALTDLKWETATSDWGSVQLNKNVGGGPMIVNEKPVANGLGTHANSVISYSLPPGATRFLAEGALDKGGVSQGGATSAQFQVWTTPPRVAKGSPTGGAKSPADALAALDVVTGVQAATFAAEPLLLSPSSIDVDARGRLWVAEVVNYRSHNGKRPEGDRILILEDLDHDGQADKQTVFYQGKDLISPHGVTVLDGAVIVAAGDKVLRLVDADKNDEAEKVEVVFSGIHGAQHDHGIHAFHFGPDGNFYFNFGNSGVELKDAKGQPIKDLAGNIINSSRTPYQQGMVFRCSEDFSRVETLGWNFRNNWECNVDSFGSIWQSDNDDDGNKSVRINFVMEYGNYGYCEELTGQSWAKGDAKTDAEVQAAHWHLQDPGVVPNLLHTGAGSPTGILIYEGSLLPQPFHNQIIHADAGPNIVRAYQTKSSGAGYEATTQDILQGTRDRWFRPSDICVAPDGSLFVADWYDPGVGGHGMGDLERGRAYRLAPAAYLAKYEAPAFDLTTPEGMVQALINPNENARYLAWKAVQANPDRAVPALEKLWQSGQPHEKARAMWAWGKLTKNGPAVAKAAMVETNADLRIAGLRLARQLGMDLEPAVKSLVKDASPAVRRECAIALRHLTTPTMPALWAELATQHDAKDPWYLAALHIGAQLRWDDCFAALEKLSSTAWDTPAGRDILWTSRAKRTSELLGKVIAQPNVPAAEKLRYVRAFDFQSDKTAVQAAISGVLATFDTQPQPADALLLALVKRVDNFDLQAAPASLKQALERYVTKSRGTTDYFDAVVRFQVASEVPELIKFISAKPKSQEAAMASKAALSLGAASQLETAALAMPEPKAPDFLQAIGKSNHREASKVLLALLTKPNLAAAAVAALGASRNGENALLKALQAKEIPAEHQFAAAQVLHASSDAKIRDAAEVIHPRPKTQGDKPLPPVAKLVKLKGNIAKGKEAYGKYCMTCHQVDNAGINFGPALSEIGNKLAKEALYQSILEPNAGISFGFEGWEIKTTKGDAYIGMIASETATELSVKVPGGVILPVAKADLAEKKALPMSLMTPGLASVMTQEELVDLVEYLTTLKKK